MRILVATDQWWPDVVGGAARVASDTARALASRGHEVVVLAPSRPDAETVEHDQGVEVQRVLRRGWAPQSIADPVVTFSEARTLRDFDVVLAHQVTNAVGVAAARKEVPLALVFHASPVLEARYLRPRLAGLRKVAAYSLDPLLVLLERRAVRRAAGVLVLSRFTEGLVAARHPRARGRVHLVGGGVDSSFFERPPAAEEVRGRLGIPPGPLLFTARRLEPRMGVDVLIDAVARLPIDRVVLAVAGTGSSRKALERQVEELALADRIRLLGHVAEDDLRSLYAAADLFVLPTVAYEGFGMSTVEALAVGTPVVGTAVGATPEILSDLGPEFVVPRADADALAAAIARVLPLVGPDLRARARRLAEKRFRWDQVILRWEEPLEAMTRR